jgi:hypothetical protein
MGWRTDMGFKVAVVGATGNVGRETLSILAGRALPADEVVPLASRKSVGIDVSYGDRTLKVKALDHCDFSDVDICLMSAGSAVSKDWSPRHRLVRRASVKRQRGLSDLRRLRSRTTSGSPVSCSSSKAAPKTAVIAEIVSGSNADDCMNERIAMTAPIPCSGGSTTGLSATDAHWVVASDEQNICRSGQNSESRQHGALHPRSKPTPV